ncbi:hypothetical protein CTM99_00165, partial [Bacillus altitudinis]
ARNGLASADRNNKATLLLTAPPHTTKSSAKDSSQLMVKLLFTGMYLRPFNQRYNHQPATIQGQRPIRIQLQ